MLALDNTSGNERLEVVADAVRHAADGVAEFRADRLPVFGEVLHEAVLDSVGAWASLDAASAVMVLLRDRQASGVTVGLLDDAHGLLWGVAHCDVLLQAC